MYPFTVVNKKLKNTKVTIMVQSVMSTIVLNKLRVFYVQFIRCVYSTYICVEFG